MKTKDHRPKRTSYRFILILTIASLFAVAIIAGPLRFVRAAWFAPHEGSAKTVASAPSSRFGSVLHDRVSLPFSAMPFAESVEVFAADCITPKSAFNLGETVCAKTDGVDVTTTPGNFYMNWVDSHLNQSNGGTITTNPQYFLYVPPTADTYKATIGRVSPADSSIVGNPPIFTVGTGPAISTYAAGCTVPKTTFTLGDTVCARISGIDPTFNRRVAWIDPAGDIRQTAFITTDPQTDSYTVPPDQIDLQYQVDNRGVWKVDILSSRGSAVLTLDFNVQGATPTSDLSVAKSKENGNVNDGSPVIFDVSIYNGGPSDAQNVVLTDQTPANTTFSSVSQVSGPGLTCTGTTTVTCTGSVLRVGERASFQFTYTAGSAGSTITNTATISSDTTDPNNSDNSATDGPYTIVTAGGGGGGTCTVACPDDIQTPANTTDGGGNSGAIVHFSPPSGNEECGTITVDHCNDCFFPEGSTLVTATAASGESCSFTVTVTAAGSSPTITCPGDKTGNADASCSATFSLGTATASGQNVTVVAYRSDGKPVYTCDEFGNCTRNSSDAPFNAGTTTVTWYAYAHDVAGPYNAGGDEESHRNGSATCVQTVVVNDVTPPTITAVNQTVSADANCQALIPDYSNSATDNCACASNDNSETCQNRDDIVVTQDVAAGTSVGLGTTTIHLTATDEANNTSTKTVTFTVVDTTPPTFTFVPPAITAYTGAGATTCDAVVDPGQATASDNCGSVTITRSPSGNTFPVGTTTITWTAKDGANNTTTATQTITVIDNTPPVITFNGQTPSMWPPNHNYHTFTPANFISSVSDNCDSLSVSDVYITSVTSDEAEDSLTLGDGTTLNDIVIAANCKSVQLRAERVNNGNGRVYTIYFKLQDTHGNFTTGSAKVYSPKNQGDTPVNDAVQYTVTSGCP